MTFLFLRILCISVIYCLLLSIVYYYLTKIFPEVRILYDFEFEKQMNALTMLDKVLKVE